MLLLFLVLASHIIGTVRGSFLFVRGFIVVIGNVEFINLGGNHCNIPLQRLDSCNLVALASPLSLIMVSPPLSVRNMSTLHAFEVKGVLLIRG
jgi:hypothetical protein